MALIGRKARLSAVVSIAAPLRAGKDVKAVNPAEVNAGVPLIPSMKQVGVTSPLTFFFPFGLNNFSHELGSVQFDELARPLQLPILQASGASLQTVSFDFMVAVPQDGISASIETQLKLLQDFVADDASVIFSSVHDFMKSSVSSWKISSMTVSIGRVNELGQATSANVNMSCKESTDAKERFLTLPKFKYKNPRGGGGGGTETPTNDDVAADLRETIRTRLLGQTLNKEQRAGIDALAKRLGESQAADIVRSLPKNLTFDGLFTLINIEVAKKG